MSGTWSPGPQGTPGADTFNGTSGANTAEGLGGNDTLNGQGGDDFLFGGDGNDSLSGGTDNDYVEGGAGNDSLSGGAGVDTLLGGIGADSLNGGGGADSIDGGEGVDTLRLNSGNDVIYLNLNIGAGTIFSSTGHTQIRLSNIENVVGLGGGSDSIVGDDKDNFFDGGSGQNTILGGAGNDTIFGGAPPSGTTPSFNRVDGGTGSNLLYGHTDQTTNGSSTVVYTSVTGAVSGTLADVGLDTNGGILTSQFTHDTGADTVGGFSNLTGSNFNDRLGGNAQGNRIDAGTGADTVFGGDGADTITATGDNVADRLFGGDGDDGINAGGGADSVEGGIGADSINAGSGADTVFGGDDNDTIIAGDNVADRLFGDGGNDSISAGGGNDFIFGGDGADTINAGGGADSVEGGIGADSINAGSGADTVRGGDDNDTIIANGDNVADRLFGDGGNDSIIAGGGADTISGGEGNNTILAGGGDDQVSVGGGSNSLDGGAGTDRLTFSTAGFYDITRSAGGELTIRFLGADSAQEAENPISTAVNFEEFSYNNGTFDLGTLGLGDDVMLQVCFASGTRILTATGEVAVEKLQPGDLVATLAGRGLPVKPVLWVGRRHVVLAGRADAAEMAPIRIKAGALGPNTPKRDLVVSPDHCLHLDGALVPARLLVNGSSVVAEIGMAEVTWYHVELETHEVLVAEGAAAESWLDCGNRSWFQNAPVAMLTVPGNLDAVGTGWDATRACAPLVHGGDQLARIRAALEARVEEPAAPQSTRLAR